MKDPTITPYDAKSTPIPAAKPPKLNTITFQGHQANFKSYNFTLEKVKTTQALMDTMIPLLQDYTEAKLEGNQLDTSLAALMKATKDMVASIAAKLKEAITPEGLRELFTEKEKYDSALAFFTPVGSLAKDAAGTEGTINFDREAEKLKNSEQVKAQIKKYDVKDFVERFVNKYMSGILNPLSYEMSESRTQEVFKMFFKNYVSVSAQEQKVEQLSDAFDETANQLSKAIKRGRALEENLNESDIGLVNTFYNFYEKRGETRLKDNLDDADEKTRSGLARVILNQKHLDSKIKEKVEVLVKYLANDNNLRELYEGTEPQLREIFSAKKLKVEENTPSTPSAGQ